MFLVLNVFVMAEEKIKIGITLLPYYSFVANIVKDRAEVIPIVKAEGFDSHTYQPKVEDIERASKVDAIVVNGVGHDEFVYKIIDAVDKKDKPVMINANKDVSLMPVAGTLGNEKIILNKEGKPYISYDTFAQILVDEINNHKFGRQRFTAVQN